MTLTSKTAVVTGSTSGIGLAIARAMAKEGANVVINGFGDADEIEKTRAGIESEFGVKAIFVETSVNPKTVRELAREAGVEIGGELYSDSMGGPGTAGESYIGMMRENVLTIVSSLR